MSDLDNEYKMLKVFSQLYVGLKKQGEGVPLLGFATPLETNKAFEKRKHTVDYWANPHQIREKQPDGEMKWVPGKRIDPLIIDNVAIEGFKISEEVRRTYWGGGNVVWRILDPRGYELEISSANLCRIIDSVGIQPGGVIPVKCLWGRLGPNNILVPEGSSLWAKTIKDAEKMDMLSKSAKKGDYKPGDIVITKTGDKRIYVGQFDVVCKKVTYERGPQKYQYGYRETETATNIELQVIENMFVMADIKDDEPGNILLYKTLKVVEVQGEYKGGQNLIEHVNKSSTWLDFAARGAQYLHLTPIAVAERGTANDVKIHVIPVENPEFGFNGMHGHVINPSVKTARYTTPLWLYRDTAGNLKQLNSTSIRLRGLNSRDSKFTGPDDIVNVVSEPVTSLSDSLVKIGYNSERNHCYSGWGYGVGIKDVSDALDKVKDKLFTHISQVVFHLNGKIIPITI